MSGSASLTTLPIGILKTAQEGLLPTYLAERDILALRVTCKALSAPDHLVITGHLNRILKTLRETCPAETKSYEIYVSILAICHDNRQPVSRDTLKHLHDALSDVIDHNDPQAHSLMGKYLKFIDAAIHKHKDLAGRGLPVSCRGYSKVAILCGSIVSSLIAFSRYQSHAPFFNPAAIATTAFLSASALFYNQWREIYRHRTSIQNTATVSKVIASHRPPNDIKYKNEPQASQIALLAQAHSFPQHLACYFQTLFKAPKLLHRMPLTPPPIPVTANPEATSGLFKRTMERHSISSHLYPTLISNSAIPGYLTFVAFNNRPNPSLRLMAHKIYENEAQNFASEIFKAQLRDLCVSLTFSILLTLASSAGFTIALFSTCFLALHHFNLSESLLYRKTDTISRNPWPLQNEAPPRIYQIVNPLLINTPGQAANADGFRPYPEWSFKKTLLSLFCVTPMSLALQYEKCCTRTKARPASRTSTVLQHQNQTATITVGPQQGGGHPHAA